ncbi:MAG: hypothetical protein WCR52_10595, partial [Bacteroidota bacterium]
MYLPLHAQVETKEPGGIVPVNTGTTDTIVPPADSVSIGARGFAPDSVIVDFNKIRISKDGLDDVVEYA